MPALYLLHILLWQPFGVAERHFNRIEKNDIAFQVSSFPSWAWCGWCFIDPWSLVSGPCALNDAVRSARSDSWHTRNLVEWRISGDLDDLEGANPKVVEEPGYLKLYTKSCLSPEEQSPRCWTRHRTWPRNIFNYIRDPRMLFLYPIPIDIKESGRPALCTASHLVFSTTIASFLAASILRASAENTIMSVEEPKISVFEDEVFGLGLSKDKNCPMLVLQKFNSAFAGLLRMMNQNSINLDIPFELIAISTGSTKADLLGWSLEWQVYSRRQYDYMWRSYRYIVFYDSPMLTKQRKYAFLCDLSLAFDKSITADDIVESTLEAVLEEVEGRVELAMQNMKQALEGRTELERKGYEQDLWLKEGGKLARNGHSPFRRDENATCEFYSVLWIERTGGVAYRRACEWVPKHIWDAHTKGLAEIVLG